MARIEGVCLAPAASGLRPVALTAHRRFTPVREGCSPEVWQQDGATVSQSLNLGR